MSHGSDLPNHTCKCQKPKFVSNGFITWCVRCGGIKRRIPYKE